MRYIKLTIFGLFLALFSHTVCYGKAKFKPTVLENAKRSVVSIYPRTAVSAYIPSTITDKEFDKQGVVIDKEAGYILTSGFSVGPSTVSEYTIGFFNSVEAPAKLIYYDTWQDFAILQIDPLVIPKEIQSAKLSTQNPLLGQSVFTIAKKKNKPAIVYNGSVDDINFNEFISWSMPQHFIRMSKPNKVLAIGSLIFNEAGEGIALNCCIGGETVDFGLHISYIHHALLALKQHQLPIRKHIGALLTTYSLDDAVRYDHLTQASQKAYLSKFPNARNKILKVNSILVGTPAAHKLFPGDLIWALNGQLVGPNLIDFDMLLNKSLKDELVLTIFRNGSFHDLTISLYNLDNHRITKMVEFGGATFFETDDFFSLLSGLRPKTLVACMAEPNTIFKVAPTFRRGNLLFLGMQFLAINSKPLKTLDDLIAQIPQLVDQKYFSVEYINHLPRYDGLLQSFAHERFKENIEYDLNLAPPKVWIWNPAQLVWKSEAIPLKE